MIDLTHLTVGDFEEAVRVAVGRPQRLRAVEATGLLDSDPEAAFDALARLAGELLGTPYALVTLVDDTRCFWKSAIGLEALPVRQNTAGESFCQYVIALDDAFLTGDARLDVRTQNNTTIASMGLVAWAGHPIRNRDGEILGTLCVVDTVPRTWDDSHARILKVLAGAAGSEIELRASLSAAEAAERTATQLVTQTALLGSLARSLSGSTTTDEVCQLIGEFGPAILGVEAVLVGLIDFDRRVLRLIAAADVHEATGHRYHELPLAAHTPLTDAIRTGQPIFIANTADGADRYPLLADDANRVGVVSSLTEPLRRTDGTVIGTMGVTWSVERTRDDNELALFDTLITLFAQTLDRTIATDSRSELIANLRDHVLGTVPTVTGLEVAVRYVPAHDHLGLGGDWYDIIELDQDRTCVIVGDVAGHGVEATARMGQIQAVVHALIRLNLDLGSVFDLAEHALIDLHDHYLATVDLFIIDRSTATLQHVSAGHVPPIVWTPDSGASLLEGGRRRLLGNPAGLAPVETVAFPAGSVLVAYTDGLIERRDEPLDHSLERLRNLVAQHAAHPTNVIADELLNRLSRAGTQPDDIALAVVAHRTASTEPAIPQSRQ